MRTHSIGLGLALSVAAGLAACSPGPEGYADWSNYRQQQANDSAYLSQRNAEAAQYQAQQGDYNGAQQSQAAADAQAAEAQQQQSHADRDRFLSGF
jgi:hypothetical protein